MADGAPLIWDLLDYIQQMEKMNAKPAFSVPTDYFIAHEYELRGLPEVRFNQQVEGDDGHLCETAKRDAIRTSAPRIFSPLASKVETEPESPSGSRKRR